MSSKGSCSITTSCCAITAGSNKEQWAETGHRIYLQTDDLGRRGSRGKLQRQLWAQWKEGRLSADSEDTYICMDQVGSWMSGRRSRTWYERQWAEWLDKSHVFRKSHLSSLSCYICVWLPIGGPAWNPMSPHSVPSLSHVCIFLLPQRSVTHASRARTQVDVSFEHLMTPRIVMGTE